ncbi:MAG: DUF2339 domain-containing protein, partial [Chthoniobacterales bacterium]
MESALLLLALLLIGVAVVFLKKITAQTNQLAQRVKALEERIKPGDEAPGVFKTELPQTPAPDISPIVAPPRAQPPPLPVRPPVGEPVSTPPTPFNWEAFMGVKLFAWLGGLALFLGVVFLVKYSFENNLISPLGRVAIGAGIGGTLVGLGWWLARGRYGITAQSLCATGIVILYADLFAAHSFHGLISLATAFFAMSAVTLFLFLLAVNLSAQVIVILGLLGGFLTPLLLRSGLDNAPALFLYLALLDLGVAAVALRKRWLYLVTLAAVGTALMQLGWAAEFFNASKGGRAFWIFLGFQALFVAIYFGEPFGRRFGPRSEAPPDSDKAVAGASKGRNIWLVGAAFVSGLVVLGFGFWLSAYPLLARQSLFFFGFIFLADAG